jgi:hypothetical protein
MPFAPLIRCLRAIRTRRELLDIARAFRERRADEMVAEITKRDIERAIYLDMRHEVDTLKARIRVAERRLMRHGLDGPGDDTD